MDREEVFNSFKKHTAEHEMTVELNEGVHRCLYFGKPGAGAFHFRIITFPGGLTFTGDMETYTFCRLRDMFQFFRGDKINPHYWSEKLQRPSQYREFDAEFAQSIVREWFEEGEEIPGLSAEEFKERVESIDRIEEVRDLADEVGYADWWDHNYEEYTFHFIWCCFAIQWAIQRYDAGISSEPAREPAHPLF